MDLIEVPFNEDIEYNNSLEAILDTVPKKTYNHTSYGLQIQIDGDNINWTVQYYSHYVNNRNLRIPIFKGSLKSCLVAIRDYVNNT